MRISDWSSDVCSSDLGFERYRHARGAEPGDVEPATCQLREIGIEFGIVDLDVGGSQADLQLLQFQRPPETALHARRSEERRVGKSVSVRVDLGGRRIIKKKK